MTPDQMLGAVGGMVDGRSTLEGTMPFRVALANGTIETVFAHGYEIIDGSLVFTVMKSKDVTVPNKSGELVKRTAIYPTHPDTLAPGTWSRVQEIFIPPANAAQIAN